MPGAGQQATARAGFHRAMPHGAQSRVLIVDDSLVTRSIIQRIVESLSGFEVAASVPSAEAALDFLTQHGVDIIILDIEMPNRDGLDALPDLLQRSQQACILVLSSHCGDGAPASIRALALGASDTLSKPDRQFYSREFVAALHQRLQLLADGRRSRHDPVPVVLARPALTLCPLQCIAIGSSTGGIPAIHQLLTALDPRVDAPILITQHLPTDFMPHFVRHIDELKLRPVSMAVQGARLQRGHIYCAPGDAHLGLERADGQVRINLLPDWPASAYKPSVDPMMQAVARWFGASGAGVMLSGMGSDGLAGARALAEQGAPVYVQDIETSTVWGMPGSVARAGLASVILPPAGIAGFIADCWLESAT
ncbi:MAG: response regulator [Blastomonas sp.]|jgi:two-component system chemotaxis response regulator CheB|uniref:protein-glutamate methylesterase n=1 Tax=Sphingomonas ursincola TaxID=56361 RepID=A0A7V8RE73_9SPHN|nr:chemotaxis protein CheB [Sphingomonas ursincola]MBA1374824.1 response regulator [Sphingomonas ursincola]MBA4781286.1 response regulator [Blastomonas sp.]MCH2236439.1 response regulator [Blastomonas sp.]